MNAKVKATANAAGVFAGYAVLYLFVYFSSLLKGGALTGLLTFTAPVLSALLARRQIRIRVQKAWQNAGGLGISTIRGYWLGIAQHSSYLVILSLIGGTVAQNLIAGVLLGILLIVVSSLAGIGAARSQLRRLEQKAVAPSDSWGWAIVGFSVVALLLVGAFVIWLPQSTRKSMSRSLGSPSADSENALKRLNQESAEKRGKQLEATGSVVIDMTEAEKNLAKRDEIASSISDPKLRTAAEAVARVNKAYTRASYEALERYNKVINDGLLSAELLATPQGRQDRRLALEGARQDLTIYQSISAKQPALLKRELVEAGIDEATANTIVKLATTRMQLPERYEMINAYIEIVDFGLSVVGFFDRIQFTQANSAGGKQIEFESHSDLEQYNKYLIRLKELDMRREIVERRLLDGMKAINGANQG